MGYLSALLKIEKNIWKFLQLYLLRVTTKPKTVIQVAPISIVATLLTIIWIAICNHQNNLLINKRHQHHLYCQHHQDHLLISSVDNIKSLQFFLRSKIYSYSSSQNQLPNSTVVIADQLSFAPLSLSSFQSFATVNLQPLQQHRPSKALINSLRRSFRAPSW